RSNDAINNGTSLQRCAGSVLSTEHALTKGAFRASLLIKNQCANAIAILVAPIEVRYRLKRADLVAWEGTRLGNAYARFYFFRREAGSPRFAGDAGAVVRGRPTYLTVPAHGSITVPITASQPLSLTPGEYGAFLQTWIL